MKKLFGIILAFFLLSSPIEAANVNIDGLPAAASVAGANLFECEQTGVNNKCTGTQMAAFIYGLMSSDATASGTGAITFATVNANVGSFGSATSCPSVTVNAKGLVTAASAATCTPAVGSITGTGTGVITALGVNVGTAGSFVVNGGALGTPSSGTATNLTGTAAGLTAGTVTTNANLTGMVTSSGNAASLGSFTSANLAAALTDETGSGANVFGTAPTLSSPTINTATTFGFLTGAGTECLQVSNTGVLSGTGSACGGSGSTGANPTATGSDTATNGVATTFLRSDASFAIQKTSASLFGLAKVDGTTITAAAGVITAVPGVTSRTVTGASDTILSTDRGNVVYYNSASSIAVTQPAPSGAFAAGFFTTICSINAGAVTTTPGSGTIGGAGTLVLPTVGVAANPACSSYQSDGTNFNLVPSYVLNASLFTGGTLAAGRMPALTGDCTTSAGAVATTCTKTGGTAFGALATVTPGTGVATAAANNLSAAGGLTTTIASGTAALGTGAITSGTCATAVTVTATNVATTDVVSTGFNGDPTATTGYLPTAMLTIVPYPTSGNVNFKVCNLTGSSITPSAVTINWRVTR